MTPSEKLVYDLCTKTSLSLWSYLSPQQPNGKELCDALVVFGDDIVIFSVKDIALSEHEDPSVVASRWTRKAIDASVKQLGGAKRILSSMASVVRQDGSEGVRLPPLASRRVHLVAVASGANRTLPFVIGADHDVGYVHVLDETALTIILTELDTTPDYLQYLRAKESFQGGIVCEGEEDLLGLYIHSGRNFPQQDHVFVDEGIWSTMSAKPEFIARKSRDAVSYWWRDVGAGPDGPYVKRHDQPVPTCSALAG